MTEHHVKIHGSAPSYVVEIDGHPVQNITEAVSLELSGRELPAVLLKLVTYSVDIDTTALIKLDPDAEVALKALGWTPPEEAMPDDGDCQRCGGTGCVACDVRHLENAP